MKPATALKLVPTAPAEPVVNVDEALRTLLRDRDRATREIAEIDAMMLAYRKRYAAERGEYMLPSLERLRRELFASQSPPQGGSN